MKKNVLIVLCLLMVQWGYSQTISLYVTSKNGCPVIPPTLSNLEQLATLSESTFIRTMQKHCCPIKI